jgi:hypothetical protein
VIDGRGLWPPLWSASTGELPCMDLTHVHSPAGTGRLAYANGVACPGCRAHGALTDAR